MNKIKNKIILFFLKKLGVIDEFVLLKRISEEELMLSSEYSAYQIVERMKREMIWEMFKEMIHDGFVVYERKNNPDRCSIDLKMKIISIKL